MKLAALAATLLAAATVTASGQRLAKTAVPSVVRQAMTAKYSGTTAPAWSVRSDKSYVADFLRRGANVKAVFSPGGEWRESSTEIGAISLPEPVRAVILRAYRGYRFADTRQIDRAAAPSRLFDVLLEKGAESVTVRFDPDGKVVSSATHLPPPPPPLPPLVVAGTWRGKLSCVAGGPVCPDVEVIYHVTPLAGDTTGFDIQPERVGGDPSEPMGKLACTLDLRGRALLCVMLDGTWRIEVRPDSLVGVLTARNGTALRRVAVRREH